ncbi:MAG TPA: tetratricopeptide repeat protein [Thermoanaerobaculia bacterium]|jgi:tetratricopeptide (TPR) repeat protein|nr:tetratricopeptide repeat protein [Thermoanaerobaculia bacterium]
MLCQTCSALNDDEREYCFRCQAKLLVLSGVNSFEEDEVEEYDEEGDVSLDEHLLERVSGLEEIVKRSAETIRSIVDAIQKHERAIFINQTGLLSVKELLERKNVVSADELVELWESKMGEQMLALEKKQRFTERKDRIMSLFRGERRERFVQLVAEAESAIDAFDPDRGIKALEEAFKLDRDNYELSFFLGEMFFNDGNLDRAKHYLERTLEVQPDHFDAAVFYGVLLHERQDLKGAERWLRRAIQISQESFLPYFSLGAIYARKGKLLRAQKFLEKAIQIEQLPQAHYLLGTIFYDKGQLERAIKSFQSALKLDPEYEEAIYHLGLCYLDRNWNRKAIDCFQEALELNPNKIEYQQAVKIYEGISGHIPLEGPAADEFKNAEVLATSGKYLEALDHYRRASAVDPDNTSILMPYALLCSHLEMNTEAIAAARRVLRQRPTDVVAAAAYTTLVEALRAEGNFKDANRALEEMLRDYTSNYAKSIAYYEKAYNLAEMEESLDEALESAQLALRYSPKELKQFPLAALGWVYFKRREFDNAVDFLTKSADLGPTATNLMHLGMALLESGQKDRARQVFRKAKSFKAQGAGLEEKILEQIRSTTKLIDRLHAKRRRTANKA